jgi:hypothetical protein
MENLVSVEGYESWEECHQIYRSLVFATMNYIDNHGPIHPMDLFAAIGTYLIVNAKRQDMDIDTFIGKVEAMWEAYDEGEAEPSQDC